MSMHDEPELSLPASRDAIIPVEAQATFYASLFPYLRESIIVTDLQGKIVSWNAGAMAIFGYTADEMYGKTPALLYPQVSEQDLARDLQRIWEGQDYVSEWQGRRKDGATIWIDVKTTLWRTDQGEVLGYIGVGTDITIRKQAEEEARQFLQQLDTAYQQIEQAWKTADAERQRLYDVLFQAPAAIAILRGPTHIYEMANALYYQIVGKTELLGKPGREAIPELTSQGIWDIFDRIFLTGEPFVGQEYPAQLERQGNGILEPGYFNFVGQPVRNAAGTIERILIHAVEVTDLVQARHQVEQLAHAREMAYAQLEAIVQQMPSGVIIAEAPSGKVIMGNAQVEAIFRHPILFSASINDYMDWQVFHLDGRPFEKEEWPLARALLRGEIVQGEEVAYVRGDQTRGMLQISAAPIRDEQGTIVFGVAIIDDITEQKALEQRKDTFIAMASHELKTPVTSIKGFAQLLLRRLKQGDDPQSVLFLTRMEAQINRLTSLINDLLDISKMQAGHIVYREELFDLETLVQEIVETFQETSQTHHVILDPLPHVQLYGDRDRIGQVLVNLLTNAIKYSPGADRVKVRVVKEVASVTMSVQDFGIGIAPAQQEHIFERFYQVSEPGEQTYPGMGIGLFIASEIVNRHHGHIKVESARGAGTTLYVTLPLPTLEVGE